MIRPLKIVFTVIVAAALIAVVRIWHIPVQPEVSDSIVVRIGDSVVLADVADSDVEHARGLSGRQSLESDHGMLFTFFQADEYAFWMKDMLFPIDIIWIGTDNRVVGVEAELSPETFPQTFQPSTPVRLVLEVPAGWARVHGVVAGSPVEVDILR